MKIIPLANRLSKASVPLYSIKAGFPSPAQDSSDEELDFNKLLIQHRASTFCLRVSGDSMVGAGICHNDIIVVDRAILPKDGAIVVASIDGEFTVKRLEKLATGLRLRAENPAYQPIEIDDHSEFSIFGVVTALVRMI